MPYEEYLLVTPSKLKQLAGMPRAKAGVKRNSLGNFRGPAMTDDYAVRTASRGGTNSCFLLASLSSHSSQLERIRQKDVQNVQQEKVRKEDTALQQAVPGHARRPRPSGKRPESDHEPHDRTAMHYQVA